MRIDIQAELTPELLAEAGIAYSTKDKVYGAKYRKGRDRLCLRACVMLAIAVALLGNSSPIGSIFAAILITIFQNGSNYMSSTLGVAKEVASMITGILLLFSACGGYFRFLAHRRLERAVDAEALAAKAAQLQKEAPADSGADSGKEGVQ